MKQWVNKDQTVTVAPTFSFFPMGSWKEWDKDCVEHYGNHRWVKAFTDHKVAQVVNAMQGQIDELKAAIMLLQKEQTEQQEKPDTSNRVKTLGGYVEDVPIGIGENKDGKI